MAALVDGPGTTVELAQRTGWSIGKTRAALDNMRRAGDVRTVEPVRRPGVKRPVPVYERTVRLSDAIQAAHVPLAHAMAAWTRWPEYAHQEVQA